MPEPIPENRHVEKVYKQAQEAVVPVPRRQAQVPLPIPQAQVQASRLFHSIAMTMFLSCLRAVVNMIFICVFIVLVLLDFILRAVVVICVFIVLGLLYSIFLVRPSYTPSQVDVTATSFVANSITTAPGGGDIRFTDPRSGIPQILCLGQNGICDAKADGPQELEIPGLRINPGQSKDVYFDYLGSDYHITSTAQPWMNLTIHVPEPHNGGPP